MVKFDGLADYRHCEKCGSGLDRLVIGGVGDWQKTIFCPDCKHIREPVPIDTLVALKARQTGMPEEKVRADFDSAQKEYLDALARVAEFS